MNIFHNPLSEEAKVGEQPKKVSRFHLPKSLRGKVALLIGVLVVIGISTVVVINLRHKASASGSCVAFNPPVQVSTPLTVVAPAVTQLATPTGLTVIPSDRTNTLSWNAVSGATAYNISRSTAPGPIGSGYSIGSSNNPSYTDNNGLTNGTTYYYGLTAITAAGESAMSSIVSGKPAAPTQQLGTPTGLTVTPGDKTNTLNWTAVSGATGYNIYSSDGFGTVYPTLPTTATSHSYTGLTNGVAYAYIVTATNATSSESNRSTTVYGTPVATGNSGTVPPLSDCPAITSLFNPTSVTQSSGSYFFHFVITSANTCNHSYHLIPYYRDNPIPTNMSAWWSSPYPFDGSYNPAYGDGPSHQLTVTLGVTVPENTTMNGNDITLGVAY